MANRFNFSNDTITGGKFVEIGKKSVDIKQRLGRFGLIQSANDSNVSLEGIGNLANDNVITPEEKKLLAQEWEHIKAAYSSTVSMVTALGVNPEEFESFKTSFASLSSIVESILSDMNKPTNTDGRFQVAIQAYDSAASILQNWINAYNNSVTAGISSYRLDIEHIPVSPTLDDTIQFTARVYIDGIDRTADLIESYTDSDTGLAPDLFNWYIEGTDDDEALIESVRGKQSFSVEAAELTGDTIRVYFSSELNVG